MSDSLLCELNCLSLYVIVLALLPIPGTVCVCDCTYVCMTIHSFVFVHWFAGMNVCSAHVCLFLV